ncbi:MarR family transcriptional regulator [Bradyrhizobium sp. B097]|uniref:MarR family transcriptional regulator n=1 Tax=Bradyrhizobium sp. B097 TaxID=3140244 RepID=UPI003183AA4B
MDELLRGILATVARQTFPPQTLAKIVVGNNGSAKHLLAYNLCDGATPQTEICKKAKLDPGNFSRSLTRWIESGVVIRIGGERLPLHVYPLNKTDTAAERK